VVHDRDDGLYRHEWDMCSYILWHVDPLLGSSREIGDCKTRGGRRERERERNMQRCRCNYVKDFVNVSIELAGLKEHHMGYFIEHTELFICKVAYTMYAYLGLRTDQEYRRP
jgi:hypothetical protein